MFLQIRSKLQSLALIQNSKHYVELEINKDYSLAHELVFLSSEDPGNLRKNFKKIRHRKYFFSVSIVSFLLYIVHKKNKIPYC